MLVTTMICLKKSTTKVYTAKYVCVCVLKLRLRHLILVGRNRKSAKSVIGL